MILILYLIPIGIYFFYKWATANYDFFEKQGIPYVKPLPLLGSNFEIFFKKQPFVKPFMDNYFKYKNHKLFGGFEFRRPFVQIRDPKLVKQLAVRDFEYFMDHRVIIDENIDEMFGRSLISLKGQQWRDMRATLSPAFTGSKMRQMFDFVNDVGKQTASTMRDDMISGQGTAFEFKSLAMKFTVDVIASCAFGIEVNSFKNPENEFHKIASTISQLGTGTQLFKMFAFMLFPKLMKALDISLIDKTVNAFIKQATLETMKIREEKGIIRHDMINLLMQARKGKLAHNSTAEEKSADGFATVEESQLGKTEVKRIWNDNDLAAQCLIFFLAGFDTVATTMSFMAYELVCNPDVQIKLFEEIQKMNKQLEGKNITYEQIQGLKYLDQVVSETLRKWPVVPAAERTCVKPYDLKYDDKTLHFTTDVNFFIPIYCFHHDPDYFINPEKFDPDRFSEENLGLIDPDTYLPFGVGPRSCIGSRFALMEVKSIFYNLMLKFSFIVTKKTKIPFEYENVPLATKPDGGFWIGLIPRD